MTQPGTLIKNLEKALASHQAGELKTASELYLKVLKDSPAHPEALHLLGVIAHQNGDHQKASELINNALTHNPTAAPYYYNLGEAQYAQSKFTEAASAYRKCVRLQPETAAAWNRLGLIEQNHNFNLEAAKDAYNNAIKYQPDFPQALNNFGLLEFSRQKYSDASKLFQKALTLHPDYVEATHNLAITRQHQGKIDEAAELFQRTIQLNSELPGAQCNYISLLQNSCSWAKLQLALLMLGKRTSKELNNNKLTEESPFLHITHSFDMQRNLLIAKRKCSVLLKPYNRSTVNWDHNSTNMQEII